MSEKGFPDINDTSTRVEQDSTSASKDYLTFRTTAVGALREVRLYDETIEKVRLGHKEVPIELPSIQDAVGKAVSDPSHVEQSHIGNSFVFVDTDSTNADGHPLRVPVRIVDHESGSGRVTTMFFGVSSAKTAVVYRRGDKIDEDR